MPQLIISVRDAKEAQLACNHGADIVDVKEPRRGSLGRADHLVLTRICRALPARTRISVALGELQQLDLTTPLDWQPRQPEFAKAGCAGIATTDAWAQAYERLCKALPAEVAPVAVAYAETGVREQL